MMTTMKKMNKQVIPDNIDEQLNESLGIKGDEDELNGGEYTPVYKMIGDNNIPISKAEGKLWNIRKKQALEVMKDVTDQWDLTYKYFSSDQISIKDDGKIEFSNNKLRNTKNNTENLVWANNTGTIPALYSQDPSIEVTSLRKNDELSDKKATMIERLINAIFQKRTGRTLGLKSKARKAILNTQLTNRGIIKIGWTSKMDGSEQAMQDIIKIGEQLEKAKDINEIKDLEGKLQALEAVVNFATESGPFIKHVRPYDLLIDPSASEQNGSDANWIMEREWIPTEYLKAKFGKENNKDQLESIYHPGKVLPINDNVEIDEENVLGTDENNDYKNYGYENEEQFKKSCLTECFWVWDKVKRRVLLFSNHSWDYPIWVWEDPYELEEFYPYYILNFQESPNGTLCKGETSYYLDQQDSINMINNQLQRMREFGFNRFLFDTNSGADFKDIQKWLNGGKKLVGIKLPMNKKFEDILFAGQVPSDKNQILYDKGDLLRVVDMISGTDATTRSGEYKTNTTNMAIQSYIAGKSIRLDDKRDLIENWIGKIGWGVAQLCLMYMSKEQVSKIIGENNAMLWENLESSAISSEYSLQCVGGSTVKPTSDMKKQQAMQMSQILGQFAGATPYVTIIMLQILQRAFDDVIVTEEDIETIKNSIVQQIQAQQMQTQQQAQLANAQAAEAETNADKNVAETTNMMEQVNGIPAEQQQETPEMLMGRD